MIEFNLEYLRVKFYFRLQRCDGNQIYIRSRISDIFKYCLSFWKRKKNKNNIKSLVYFYRKNIRLILDFLFVILYFEINGIIVLNLRGKKDLFIKFKIWLIVRVC